ncbi:hypothetical protein [Nocardia testacea]|uniref:hypothetical protein n=1 Tax=Nocardia testacea TaxID=248551 RepID=UPI00030700F6|nr:hypothetical protein [Nocardia testacea]
MDAQPESAVNTAAHLEIDDVIDPRRIPVRSWPRRCSRSPARRATADSRRGAGIDIW